MFSGQKRLKKRLKEIERRMGRKSEKVPRGVYRMRGCSGRITEVALWRFTAEKVCCFPVAANIGTSQWVFCESLYSTLRIDSGKLVVGLVYSRVDMRLYC